MAVDVTRLAADVNCCAGRRRESNPTTPSAVALLPLSAMVEGHQVHRVAQHHRRTLLGRAFVASSPNGRFNEGARAIDGSVLHKVEAVGKNLFYFFANPASVTARPKSVTTTGTDELADAASVVMHVHFGMSGRFGVWDLNTAEPVPEPTDTTRLKLVN